jgi:hypothetical protein
MIVLLQCGNPLLKCEFNLSATRYALSWLREYEAMRSIGRESKDVAKGKNILT